MKGVIFAMEYVGRYSENIILEQEFIDDINNRDNVHSLSGEFAGGRECESDANKLMDEYIMGVACKDKEAFRNLYEMTKSKVYSYALAMIKNHDDALDILHDVFIKIFDNAHMYSSKGKPLAWIFTITRNEVLMKMRKQKHMVDIDDLSECLEYNKKITVEDKLILKMLFKEMTDIERKILLLHVVTGYKFHEIARSLGMPTATVITKYNRLIKRIKKNHSKEFMYEG
jgi:RNA polymerase sigma-70 factor (ECF subfamily)